MRTHISLTIFVFCFSMQVIGAESLANYSFTGTGWATFGIVLPKGAVVPDARLTLDIESNGIGSDYVIGNGDNRLYPGDLVYQGAFLVPKDTPVIDGISVTYGTGGVTSSSTMNWDSVHNSILMPGQTSQNYNCMGGFIPALPVISPTKNATGLNRAVMHPDLPFTDLTGGLQVGYNKLSSAYYDGDRYLWTICNDYDVAPTTDPRFGINGAWTSGSVIQVSNLLNVQSRNWSRWIVDVDDSWAKQNLSHTAFGLGTSRSGGSFGPSLFFIDKDFIKSPVASLPNVQGIHYDTSHAVNSFSFDDKYADAVWVNYEGKRAFVVLVRSGFRAETNINPYGADRWWSTSGAGRSVAYKNHDLDLTTLAHDITDTDTSISLADVSKFPSKGYIHIDSELIYYGSIDRAANTLLFAQRGLTIPSTNTPTAPENHSAGAGVTTEMPDVLFYGSNTGGYDACISIPMLHFYDANQIAEIVSGERQSWDIQPYAYMTLDQEFFRSMGALNGNTTFRNMQGYDWGIAVDKDGHLYIGEKDGEPETYNRWPVIHQYGITGEGNVPPATPPAAPADVTVNNGTVSWKPSDRDVLYVIFKWFAEPNYALPDGEYRPIRTSLAPAWTDTHYSSGDRYEIIAYDRNMNASEPAYSEQQVRPELDSRLISIVVNGTPYIHGDTPVTLETDQVFPFSVTMENTGTASWGDYGERGNTLFSRNPDYNTDFGVFLISPNQGKNILSGEQFTFGAPLRAPSDPGVYTMTWQLVDWIMPYDHQNIRYYEQPFYGDAVTVTVNVVARTEQQPPQKPHVPGILDMSNFEYAGSFTLPKVPDAPQDDKAFSPSGITLRTVDGEKRLIMTTGQNQRTKTLYEVAIPPLGKFIGSDASQVPAAPLRTVFGNLPVDPTPVDPSIDFMCNGTMWFDQTTGVLYWTNWDSYLNGGITFPVLRAARLDGGILTETQQWYQPQDLGGAPFKSFWGGVTVIPDDFAALYTGGRKLGLGFGGNYSINANASLGPALAAVSVSADARDMDMVPIFYSTIDNRAIRDGNYIGYPLPDSPWLGHWTDGILESGVFIDLPDVKGYVTFTKQITGRINYDWAGTHWNATHQNAWYFYDYETLGKAVAGETSKLSLEPSSIAVVNLPYDPTSANQEIKGSCFDPDTRLLYLYTKSVYKYSSQYAMYNEYAVHAYYVKEETSGMDAELVGFSYNDVPWVMGDAPPEIPAGQVFIFGITMENTGTQTWIDNSVPEWHPATFLSRDPDYNSNFGTFVMGSHGYKVQPGETFDFRSSLRAPELPGTYTMTWQLAEWALNNMEWAGADFFGEEVTFTVVVTPRTDSPPPDPGRIPGVVDGFDLEYAGSFSLPAVPGAIAGDDKTFFASGITLRKVAGEKRMLLTTGVYEQTLYEVAIPTPGKIVGSDVSAVPKAAYRTTFGELTKFSNAHDNGSMYYDQDAGLLYWANYHHYLNGPIDFPILRSADLSGGTLTETAQWYQPDDAGGAPSRSFWGGVTNIPKDFANRYTGGNTLAMGFGGNYSINAGASWGPALAAVGLPGSGGTMDMQPIFNYSMSNPATRDGNYFFMQTRDNRNPSSPWEGWWGDKCTVGTGVFIDLPDKKGYVSFNRLPIGRVGYDYGGQNWNGAYQNVWNFYDYETLGQAATGDIPRTSVTPSSVSIVDLPNEATSTDQIITGSCFDPETRTLYVYSLHAVSMPGVHMYLQPLVHTYYVKEDIPVNTVSWLGKTSEWDEPANWDTGKTPAATDTVVISAGVNKFPVLKDNVSVAAIRFKPEAQIGNQSKLNAGKAFVQYDLSKRERWNMLSIPLGEVYPADFVFGGYPATWVRTFETTAGEGTATIKGNWVTARESKTAFSFGDGFVLWLNRDGDEEKGLKLLKGSILELPNFHNFEVGSESYGFYHDVNLAHDFVSGGTEPETGTSWFYQFTDKGGGYYIRNEEHYYDVTRHTDAYQLAGGHFTSAVHFDESGFVLTGNPFMAALDFDEFHKENSGTIKPNYQIFTDKGYVGYCSVTGTTFGVGVSTPWNEFIAPLQGFIIEKTRESGASASLKFNEEMTTVHENPALRSSVNVGNKLEILAHNSVAGVRTTIAEREGGQDEFGNLDARKIINEISEVPEIYTLKPHKDGQVAVAVNLINSDELLIPVGLATSYTGNITFMFTGMDSYDANLSLIDTETGQTIDLTGLTSCNYTFNYSHKNLNEVTAADEDRFFIRISKSATGLFETTAEKVNVFESNSLIRVVSAATNPIKEVSVYSLQGVLIYKLNNINAVSHTVERNLPAGVYIVKVVSEKTTEFVKLVKKK